MRKTTLLASLVLAPALASASGYSLPNTHPRDLAVCASGVAAQDDAAAAFALPAALARVNGPSIRLGGGAVSVRTDWTDPGAAQTPVLAPASAPTKSSLSTQWTGFPDIALAYGGKFPGTDRGWGVGLAVQPFGGSILKWPDDWAGRYHITRVDREVFSGILGAGVEILPQVRFGGGLIYYYTKEKFTQHLWQGAFGGTGTPNPAFPDAVANLDLTGGGFSFDVSLEVELMKNLNLAFDYKHKASQDLTGDVSWSGVSPVLQQPPTGLGDPLLPLKVATSTKSAFQTLTIPNTFNFGAAFRPVKPLLVTATFTLDRWIVYDSDTFVGETGFTLVVPRHYKNGQTYRAGVAYDVIQPLTVRVGVQRDVSGLRREFYSPTLPDASSWGGSAGFSFRFAKGFSFDAAGFYAKMDKVTAANPGFEPGVYGFGPVVLPTSTPGTTLPGTFRGTYQPSAWVFSGSLNWTPGASM